MYRQVIDFSLVLIFTVQSSFLYTVLYKADTNIFIFRFYFSF